MHFIDLLSDDDEDDALLMGSTQPIFAYSAPRTKTKPVITAPKIVAGAAPTTTAVESSVAVAFAPVQDSKAVVTNLGSCHFSIVGMHYNIAKVAVGESVKLQREPTNVSKVVAVLCYWFRQRYLYRYHSLTSCRYSLLYFCHWYRVSYIVYCISCIVS